MGGKPIMALAILGWPISKLPEKIASKIIEGARKVCDQCDIPLAGGHSIESSDPIFGLAVTGVIDVEKIKTNDSAKEGDILYLTKPIGTGLVSTAEKMGIAKESSQEEALEIMCQLNKPGYDLAYSDVVSSLTDVTGFGLGGHLLEMAEASGLSVNLYYDKIPKIKEIEYYLKNKCSPGGTRRNFASYGKKIAMSESQRALICDPQTSGGLLVAAKPDNEKTLKAIMKKYGQNLYEIGVFKKKSEGTIIRVI